MNFRIRHPERRLWALWALLGSGAMSDDYHKCFVISVLSLSLSDQTTAPICHYAKRAATGLFFYV